MDEDEGWEHYPPWLKGRPRLEMDLTMAQMYSQRALESVYTPSGPIRRGRYRRRLLKAQNALMRLQIEEINRRVIP